MINKLIKGIDMKTKLTALAVAGLMAASANASVITLDTTGFGGTNTFDFDLIQFVAETGSNQAQVIQTDTSGDGTIAGPDGFMEMGGTSILSFNLDGSPIEGPAFNPAYDIVFDYQVGGMASQDLTGDLNVTFDNLVTGRLYAIDRNGPGAADDVEVNLATFGLNSGNCDIRAAVSPVNGSVGVVSGQGSGCNLSLSALFEDNFFADAQGIDLGQYDELGYNVTVDYHATVSAIDGLYASYAHPNAVHHNGDENTQVFNVSHTADMSINVPEPTTLAILGLGLLGLAGARRRA